MNMVSSVLSVVKRIFVPTSPSDVDELYCSPAIEFELRKEVTQVKKVLNDYLERYQRSCYAYLNSKPTNFSFIHKESDLLRVNLTNFLNAWIAQKLDLVGRCRTFTIVKQEYGIRVNLYVIVYLNAPDTHPRMKEIAITNVLRFTHSRVELLTQDQDKLME